MTRACPTLCDSHCHLLLLDEPATEALAAARNEGVERLLCVAVELAEYPRILELCATHPGVSGSIGIHPNWNGSGKDIEATELARLAEDPRIVAIGETGLDYCRQDTDPLRQQERFRHHVRAARTVGKPLIVHSRAAREDTLHILEEEKADEVGGVMHCFTEDLDTARRAMALRFAISFSGIVTFKNAASLREVARRIPEERLLVETDAPYLAPVPHRGKPNRPAYIRHTVEHLAKTRGVSPQVLATATTRNYLELFRPPD